MISPEGEEYLLDAELIPSYPIVVIKNNERMICDRQNGFNETKSTRVMKSSDGISYKFASDIFDNELQAKKAKEDLRAITIPDLDQKIVDAYYLYQSADGWQRDYIYYGITPSQSNSPLSYDFVEHIRSFKISGDARPIYTEMAKQTTELDPTIKDGRNTGWTEGSFEIAVNVLVQAKNGTGADIKNSLSVSAHDLFDVTYSVSKRGFWPFRYNYFTISTVTAKEKLTNFPIVNWDLNNYAASFRIDIEETDNTTVISESTVETQKFATNFGIDAMVLKKIGLKFGASLELTRQSTLTRQYTLGSYQMGTVLVNFADKVIISECWACAAPYNSREYSNNTFSISVEPKRVQ